MSGTFNINQINVNVTDVIPPDNFATVDAGSKVGTVYTKAQDNEWREEVEATVQSGIKGVLKPNTPYDAVTYPYPKPWVVGDSPLYEKYDVNQPGAFPSTKNIDDENIVVTQTDLDLNEVQIWIKNGVAEKVLKALPQATQYIAPFEVSSFPLVGSSSDPVQRKYNNSVWELKDGETADSTDLPTNEFSKWIELNSEENRFSFKLDSAETLSAPADLQFMVSAKPAPFTGFLKYIELISNSSGKAKFSIIKRETYNNSPEVAGGQDSFGSELKFEIDNILVGRHVYDVSAQKILIKEKEYLGMTNDPGYILPQIANSQDYGWWQSGSSALLTYQPNDAAFTFAVEFEKFETKKIPERNFTVSKNLIDFNSIRDFENILTDSSEENKYKLFIPKETYREIDWQGRDFVEIVGESRDETIIQMNGNSTDLITPSDYAYPAYANKAFNLVPREYLHLLFIKNDSVFRDLTLKATRAKYTVHIDSPEFQRLGFYNCRILEEDTNYPIGIGLWSGQVIEFVDCIIERTKAEGGRLGFFVHNATAQTKGAKVRFIRCHFINCGYGLISETGSNQNDLVELIDCTNDGVAAIEMMVEESAPGFTMWINPLTGLPTSNPTEVPYNLKVRAINTRIDIVKDRPDNFAGGGLTRPEYYKHYEMDYIKKTAVFPAVTAGTVLTVLLAGLKNYCFHARAFSNANYTGYILGTAINDSGVSGEVYFVPAGKIAKTNVLGDIYANQAVADADYNLRQKLTFDVSGNLVPSPLTLPKEADAISYDAVVVDGKAYVKIL